MIGTAKSRQIISAYGDRASVTFEDLPNARFGAVAAGLVDVALLAADNAVVDVTRRKTHGSDGGGTGRSGEKLQGIICLIDHVQVPAAQHAVRRAGDEIVGVLGTHNTQGVDGVGVSGGWTGNV